MSTAASTSIRSMHRGDREYEYPNARIRGMRGKLLSAVFLEELLQSRDVGAIIQKLAGTEYGPDLEARILDGRTATQVDEALKDNLVRTFRSVYRFSNAEMRLLLDVLLGRWDVFNIKTVLRGKHTHCSREEIEQSVIPIGKLSAIDVDHLIELEDMRAVVDTLVTWDVPLARVLRGSISAVTSADQMAAMELALDRGYHSWAETLLLDGGDRAAVTREFISNQVDTLNIMTGIRLLGTVAVNIVPDEVFLQGGARVSKQLFAAIVEQSDIDGILGVLKDTPYGRVLDDPDVVLRSVERGTLSVFERALEEAVFRRSQAAGRRDGEGFGLTISYLWAKVNEVTNIRIIVRGLAVGMPLEHIREELIGA